jgi:hypothetical protein
LLQHGGKDKSQNHILQHTDYDIPNHLLQHLTSLVAHKKALDFNYHWWSGFVSFDFNEKILPKHRDMFHATLIYLKDDNRTLKISPRNIHKSK